MHSDSPLSEGPVSGVMRKYLLERMKELNLQVQETPLTVDSLQGASEIFLTNAIYGIRWVKQMGENWYMNKMAGFLHKKLLVPGT